MEISKKHLSVIEKKKCFSDNTLMCTSNYTVIKMMRNINYLRVHSKYTLACILLTLFIVRKG